MDVTTSRRGTFSSYGVKSVSTSKSLARASPDLCAIALICLTDCAYLGDGKYTVVFLHFQWCSTSKVSRADGIAERLLHGPKQS